MKNKMIIVVFCIILTCLLVCRKTDNDNQFMMVYTSGKSLITLTGITNELCPTSLLQGDFDFDRRQELISMQRPEFSPAGIRLIAAIDFCAC